MLSTLIVSAIQFDDYLDHAANGENIDFIDNITDEDCKIRCEQIQDCTGLTTSPNEMDCWLKRGDFMDTIHEFPRDQGGIKAANTYVVVIGSRDAVAEGPNIVLTDIESVTYEKLDLTRADGQNIFYMAGTEAECILACSSDMNCSGFEHNFYENVCWLKTGSFWDDKESNGNSNVFIQHKSADVQPSISDTPRIDYIYDHYDYLKGIDDINNTIKSLWNASELIFLIHMFYMTDLDMSEMHEHIDTINRNFKDNGCPFQFRLENATRIPEETIEYPDDQEARDRIARLEETYSVIAPNTVTIFCGDVTGTGFAGMQNIYIDKSSDIAGILTHELGHWLGLPHTFGDCYPGDFVIDTPPAKGEYRYSLDHGNWFQRNIWNPIKGKSSIMWISGISSPNTCGYANDQVENFMDYVTKASKFTPGQVYRMMVFGFYKLVGRMPRYENGIIV